MRAAQTQSGLRKENHFTASACAPSFESGRNLHRRACIGENLWLSVQRAFCSAEVKVDFPGQICRQVIANAANCKALSDVCMKVAKVMSQVLSHSAVP